MKKSFVVFALFITVGLNVFAENAPFVNISEKSGIQKGNFVKNPAVKIPINDHSRLRVADINGDLLDDIIMLSLYPNPLNGVPFETLVFINNGDGTFTDFSEESGLKNIQAGFMLFADFDNDGDQDCFAGLDIPMEGEINNMILKNDGKGRFTIVKNSGVELKENMKTGTACAADFDNDGNLDLFVGNGHSSGKFPDLIYKGNGDLTFSLVKDALPDTLLQPTNGVVACDFDNDGDQDILVSTYGVSILKGHNVLWENLGDFKFKNVADKKDFDAMQQGNYLTELAGNGSLDEKKDGVKVTKEEGWIGSNGFGIDTADVNYDGYFDIFLATISHPSEVEYTRAWSDPSMLLINTGKEGEYKFVNETKKRNIPFVEGDIDASFVDFDNDGIMDIAVSRESKYDKKYEDEALKSWFGLTKGLKNGTYENYTFKSGINDLESKSNMKSIQNFAWFDMEHDGDLDLVLGGRDLGGGRPNYLFENIIGNNNKFIVFKLIGDGKSVNKDAIGARVKFIFDDKIFVKDVKSSSGTYCSQNTRLMYFGMERFKEYFKNGNYKAIVEWPDGTTNELKDLKLNSFNKITKKNEKIDLTSFK